MTLAAIAGLQATTSLAADNVVERKSQGGFYDPGAAQAARAHFVTLLNTKAIAMGNNYYVKSGVKSRQVGRRWNPLKKYEAWAELRWRNPFQGSGGGGGKQYRIWIENPNSYRVFYSINGKSFFVDPGKTRWHSRTGNSTFNVAFDWSFASGYQRRSYRLTPGSRNYFRQSGNTLDLYRRCVPAVGVRQGFVPRSAIALAAPERRGVAS